MDNTKNMKIEICFIFKVCYPNFDRLADSSLSSIGSTPCFVQILQYSEIALIHGNC